MVSIVRPPDSPIVNPNQDIILDCARTPPVCLSNHVFLTLLKAADPRVERAPDKDPPQRSGDRTVQRPADNPIAYRPSQPPDLERPQ